MKLCFTSLALGSYYLKNALIFSKQLFDKDLSIPRILVVDNIQIKVPKNTQCVQLEPNSVRTIQRKFNYNLKYQAISAAIKLETDYIIYTDADFNLHPEFSIQKITNFLEQHPEIDCHYMRPCRLGDNKLDQNCIFKNKLEPYGLLKTKKYDDVEMLNENWFILKHTDKLKIFLEKWKERNLYGIRNNVFAYAEAIEIGLSLQDAKMSSRYIKYNELFNLFTFKDISGNFHTV